MLDVRVLASSSKGNACRVSDGKTTLLLDCGLSFKDLQTRLGYEVSNLAGCLLTHEHGDHSRGAQGLLKAGIDCYMSQGTAEALGLKSHRVNIVRALEQFRVGSWAMLPFDTIHDAAEPLGYLLASGQEKVLYVTDTAYLRYRFRGLTSVCIECNHSLDLLRGSVRSGALDVTVKNRIVRNHMSLENLKGFFKANDLSQVREIWLLHLSDGNSDAERFKREIQQLTGKPVCVADA